MVDKYSVTILPFDWRSPLAYSRDADRCMMLTQCIGFENFPLRRAAQIAHIMVPLDAPRALVVEYVATALDERVFARGATQIAQIILPRSLFLLLFLYRHKTEKSNSCEFELNKPSIKGTKLLLNRIKVIIIIRRGDGSWAKKGKNKKSFWYPTPKKNRAGPDGPNASGWYERLRRPISPLSVFKSVQLWQQSFHVWYFLDKVDSFSG